MTEAEAKAAKIAAAQAKHAADVAREKAQMEANLAKMKAKKPLTDAEAQKMKSSITGEKPSVEGEPRENLRSRAKKARKAAATKPATVSAGSPAAAAKPPAATPQVPGARATAHPSNPIELPNRPLPGQGSMEGKPVEKVLVKTNPNLVTDEGVAKWKADVDAERRITQGSAPEAERRAALQAKKVMTSTGVVESTVPKATPAPKPPVGPPKMTAADLFPEVSHARPPMIADDIGLQVGKLSVRQRVARAAGAGVGKAVRWAGTPAGKAAVGVAEHIFVEPFKPAIEFAQGGAARRAAWEAAGPAGKTYLAGRTAVTGAWAGARTAGRIGLTIGEGLAMEGAWWGGREAAKQTEAVVSDAKRERAHNAKFGLKVSAPEYNETLFRAFTGGAPKLKVHDTTRDVGADGKSLSQKRRERGQEIFEYNRAKSAAGRNVITGSSKK